MIFLTTNGGDKLFNEHCNRREGLFIYIHICLVQINDKNNLISAEKFY